MVGNIKGRNNNSRGRDNMRKGGGRQGYRFYLSGRGKARKEWYGKSLKDKW